MKAKISRGYFRKTDFAEGKIQDPNRHVRRFMPLPLYQRKWHCLIYYVYAIGETPIIGGFTVSKHSKRITFCVLAGDAPDPENQTPCG